MPGPTAWTRAARRAAASATHGVQTPDWLTCGAAAGHSAVSCAPPTVMLTAMPLKMPLWTLLRPAATMMGPSVRPSMGTFLAAWPCVNSTCSRSSPRLVHMTGLTSQAGTAAGSTSGRAGVLLSDQDQRACCPMQAPKHYWKRCSVVMPVACHRPNYLSLRQLRLVFHRPPA